MLARAATERRDVHWRDCLIFDVLLAGIIGNASAAAFATNPGIANVLFQAQWRAESILAMAYVRCIRELLPMVDVGGEDNVVNPCLALSVNELMLLLKHVLNATRCHGPLAPLASAAHWECFARTIKLHRAALACCTTLARSMLWMFVLHVPIVLRAMIKMMV
jgi:hypothetical protein